MKVQSSRDSSFLNSHLKEEKPRHVISEDISADIHTIVKSGKQISFTREQMAKLSIDPTHKVVLYYNMACCY